MTIEISGCFYPPERKVDVEIEDLTKIIKLTLENKELTKKVAELEEYINKTIKYYELY